jgi:hypothetical protein
MSNSKTTQLSPRIADQISANDLFPFVDVDANTSPTGETVYATLDDLAIKLSEIISPTFVAYDVSNGLNFSGSNGGSANTSFQSIGSSYTLSVRVMLPSGSSARNGILFGVGTNVVNSLNGNNAFYLSVNNEDLIGYYNDAGGSPVTATIIDFFGSYYDRVVNITFVSNNGQPKMYANGTFASSVSSSSSQKTVASNSIFMNQSATANNVNYVIYDAHVWNRALSDAEVKQAFYGGPKRNDDNLIASYVADNLNPSQWLDNKNNYHLLVPIANAKLTEPSTEFNLKFFMTSSGYMGDGTARNVLPEKYVLTSAMVSSSAAPLLSIGSSPAEATVGDSGLGSFSNNRVAQVSASYGINQLDLLTLGSAHPDRTLYVSMSSAENCSFDFKGYILN